MNDTEWSVTLFALLFGGLAAWSLVVSLAGLDAVTPGTGWDFTGDRRVSAADVVLYLRYNLCTPVHLAISAAPPGLRAALPVQEARPFNGLTEMVGAALWASALVLCAKLGGALGNRLGRPDPGRKAAQDALRAARQAERQGRRRKG